MSAEHTPPARTGPRTASPRGAEPVRFTWGLAMLAALLVLPAILALTIVLGAWAVSGEVYAAEQAAAAGAPRPAVAPWKTTLVGVCPIH